MKLAEWAEVQEIYKRSRRQPNKRLFNRANARRLWPMWAGFASTLILIAFLLWAMARPALLPYACMAFLPWGLALYLTRAAGLRTMHAQAFADQVIDRQSIHHRESTLCYTFFLESLRNQGYTAAKARELSAYSDLIGKPPRPPVSQNLGFASLVAFMIAISTELIKNLDVFTRQGAAVVMMGVAALFIYWLVLDGIYSGAYQKAWIKRYLDMAAWDLEHSTAFDDEAAQDWSKIRGQTASS
ncbi:hypothetical protein [Pseudomonas plecoglossicida]|uniref:hypothetical protein n=1 Tax=Pseudomonas plecoglossicida TaxID=70775 RepID=UPI00048AB374|nr:hypothetical protein [Pseudomonas plecoglossicida]GLR35103.1 hypothetical protein GCM10011247_05000 [Pseudomonas plecoglossicida]